MTSRVWRLGPDDWQIYREIRLAALEADPTAFGSSWSRESEFTEQQWRERLAAVVFGADFAGEMVGTIGGFYGEKHPGSLHVMGMWVRSEARGSGVSGALLAALHDHAVNDGAKEMRLWVTESNASARRLYERWGFEDTGEREALLSDPTIPVIEMLRDLASSGP